MTTATMQRRTTILGIFSAVSAMLAEIYGRVGSTEAKSEGWYYFAA